MTLKVLFNLRVTDRRAVKARVGWIYCSDWNLAILPFRYFRIQMPITTVAVMLPIFARISANVKSRMMHIPVCPLFNQRAWQLHQLIEELADR
jgi:hypothetical protein